MTTFTNEYGRKVSISVKELVVKGKRPGPRIDVVIKGPDSITTNRITLKEAMVMANKLGKITSISSESSDVPRADNGKLSKEAQLRERKWKAEDALRTLTRCNEIIKDRQLMADVKELAKEQMKGLQSIGKR